MNNVVLAVVENETDEPVGACGEMFCRLARPGR
jgi:hypothetical protein